MNALKAGAVAVKTYGWYWTINQKYPGQGYDVKDSTADQVYKPGSSHPRTDQAIEETWNWVMTKNGQIFQSQYDSGTPGSPNPLIPGRMSQWGTQYWAERGKDWQWILHYYYDPIALSLSSTAIPSEVLSPVIGDLEIVSSLNQCTNTKWCFNQHKTGGHVPGGGVCQSDDTYAWDANLNTPSFDSDAGKPVYAVAAGVVTQTFGGCLNTDGTVGQVLIEHTFQGSKWWSGYLHMGNIQVARGQNVDTNTILGYVSNVGANNNHLHFVVYTGQNTQAGLISFDTNILPRSATALPQITSKSLSTSTATQGQTITFNYTINNPNSTSVSVTLGAQIRTSSPQGSWIDDYAGDRNCTLAPNTTTPCSRPFQVPPNGNVSTPASPGWYDANWVIFQAGNPANRYDEELSLQALNVQAPDTTPPPAPIGLNATPSSWTNNNLFSINWTNPSDPSGIAKVRYKVGSPPTYPTDGIWLSLPQFQPFSAAATSQGGQLIYVWLEDGAGNTDHNNRATTTLYYDGTPPTCSITINNGAANTSSLIVNLNISASDSGGSGLSQMRFSNNNSTWSSWESYSTFKSNWDLSSYGGNTNSGTKTVYAQVKDQAGNISSTSCSDSINYQATDTTPPALVTDFSANPGNGQCTLSWTNPGDSDLSEVLVKRKTGSYPANHTDGATVYDNTSPTPGANINQVNSSLSNGTTYYYTVFSKDASNNWNDTMIPGSNAGTCTPQAGNNPPNTPSNPSPPNNATNVDVNADLSWTGSDPDGDPLTFDVYFGTSSSPPLVSSNQSTTTYDPGLMNFSTAYYWQIVAKDGQTSTSGPVWQFTTASQPKPANDDFVDAQVITGNSGTVTGSNVGATKELGEPNHAGNAGGASVWYRWTAPSNGTATIDTNGSSFDTLLGVYIGNSVSSLTLIVSDDDSGTGLNSFVTFSAQVGTTYQIAVDGFAGATGNVTLNWNLATAGTTATFRVERQTGNVYAGQYYCGLGSPGQVTPPAPPCYLVGNADIAERIHVSEPVEPGDVIEIDPENPGRYRKAQEPYSPRAAGVISINPGFTLANLPEDLPDKMQLLQLFSTRLTLRTLTSPVFQGRPWLSALIDEPMGYFPTNTMSIAALAERLEQFQIAGRPLLALMGRVKVKATTENGPIQVGDLLVSSSKPGYAMRCAEPSLCVIGVIGKALEPLREREGLIEILVMR